MAKDMYTTFLYIFEKTAKKYMKCKKCKNAGIAKQSKWVIGILVRRIYKCGPLRDLVPFVQFKKREKHPWRSVNFSKVAGFSPQLY